MSRPRSLYALRPRDELLLFVLHLLGIGFLAFHYRRYVAELVSFPVMGMIIVLAAAAAYGVRRAGLRGWVALVAFGAVAVLLRYVGVGVLGVLQSAGSGEGAGFSRLVSPTIAFDRAFTASLPAAAVAYVLSVAVLRRPRLYAWHPALLAPLVVAMFWSQGPFNVTMFSHPTLLAVTVSAFLLVELALVVAAGLVLPRAATSAQSATAAASVPSGGPNAAHPVTASLTRRFHRGELGALMLLLLPLLLLVLFLFLERYSEASTSQGGGLIRPTLFRFDFADYVNLESEISLSRDLVLLYREETETERQERVLRSGERLLRRFVLAGYDPGRGFYAEEDPHGEREPRSLGEEPRSLSDPGHALRSDLRQEYYLVNFDPSSLLAVNYPVEVAPYENYSDSSFSRIYEVESRASDAPREALTDARVPRPQAREAPGEAVSEQWYRFYTDYGGNERLAELAREVTGDVDGDYAEARALEQYFLDEYYYSLRPGVAPDGNQLEHFLFESRKGYCSYFAFSMALMARSLGLPARVAVGFFVEPRMSVMDYYPVRADMAHAWVEIYFEDYGWIEFDPTSTTLAPGEDFETDVGMDMDEISALLEELLSRRNELGRAGREDRDNAEHGEEGGGGMAALYRFLRRSWPLVLLAFYLLIVTAYRLRPWLRATVARDYRGRVQGRFRAMLRALAAAGFRAGPGETPREYALRLSYRHGVSAVGLVDLYLKAMFGESFPEEEYRRYLGAESRTRRSLREVTPLWRRILGFLAPYLRVKPASRAGADTVAEGGAT
ncbi:MAG: transglutaminase domain-containing protein [Spirochaetota bacterium]